MQIPTRCLSSPPSLYHRAGWFSTSPEYVQKYATKAAADEADEDDDEEEEEEEESEEDYSDDEEQAAGESEWEWSDF